MTRIVQDDNDLWNSYLKKLPSNKQDIYFSAEYHKSCECNNEGKPVLFVYEKDGKIALYPFLLNEIDGYDLDKKYYDIQSAYGYSGPLVSDEADGFINEFESQFLEYAADSNIVAEFIRFHPLINNRAVFSRDIDIIKNREIIYLCLENDSEKIFKNQLNPACRRAIRNAERKNLNVEINNKFDEFIKIYIQTMNALNADEYYFFNNQYFEAVSEIDEMFSQNIIYENKVIAAGIFFVYGDYGHYHLGGNDKDYSTCTPMDFLLWEAVKYAKKKGCKFFNFGGGRTTVPGDSLLKFKSKFSKDREAFYIGKRIINRKIYDKLIRQWEREHNKKAIQLLEYRNIGRRP